MKSKKWVYVIMVALFSGMLISFAAFKNPQQQQPDKIYKIKESTINATRNTLGGLYQYLDKSNLPQQEAKSLKEAIAQADAAIQKDLSDSTLNVKQK